ncbi:hypothetical protein GJ744_002718 [Endocarpon pusillum]|uniref:Uncharacterized protein n=1 Tax=Endocarpon pusillum TaxID=364733 RepID=A0A8H7E864_9EURO|nr:hypothetical protein GJ744_002718 [Endocarpon pusillum]
MSSSTRKEVSTILSQHSNIVAGLKCSRNGHEHQPLATNTIRRDNFQLFDLWGGDPTAELFWWYQWR